MLTNLSKKLLLTLLVVVTSAAGAFSQSGTRVEAQGTDSILFYNNNVKTAALSNTGSFRLGATETFQATALFQLNSASQGFLAPRMTTTDRGNIVAPATGLLIYNTTTNQFDYYDGAAWLSVFSSATGNDGDWTVSGADMYSGVSGNVGIGTSSPGKIAGSSKYFTLSRGDAAGGPTMSDDDVSIELHGGSSAGVGVQSKIEFIARTTAGSDVNTGRIEMTNSSTNTGHGVMRFYTNGGGSLLERVTILETGNVGIGTTLPSTPLAILGNGGVQPVGITQNSVGATATMELTTQDGAGNQATRLMLGGNGNTPDAVFYSGASGSETATVHIEGTNGRVGIGITNPSYELDIHGTTGNQILNMESGDAALNTMAGARFSMGNGAIGTQYYAYAEKTDNTVNATASDFVMRKDFSTAGGYLKFFRYENSSQDIIFNDTKTTTAAFGDVLIANGNVGIGTPSPSEKLDVVGNVNYSNALKVNGSFGTAGYLLTSQAGGVNTWTDPASLAATSLWTDGGSGDTWLTSLTDNVGIGTTTPVEQIQLTGTNAAIDGSDGVSMLISNSTATTGSTASINFVTNGGASSKGKTGLIHEDTGSNGIGKLHLAATSTTTLAYKVGVADAKLTVRNDGYVGIGTTTPGTLLDIEVPASNAANGGLDIHNADATGTYDPRIRFQVNATNMFSMGVDNSLNDNFTIASSANLGGSPRFAITTGGNVGIGTTAPAYKLDVNGEARIGYMGSPDTIQLIPSDFIIVFGESAMHQFGENWGIGPIAGQGPQHFMAQIPIPVGYKAKNVVIKTFRGGDNNYPGNPHDCFIWSMRNQSSRTASVPFATASVTGDGLSIATFADIVAHGNSYVGIEVRDIPELPGNPADPPQEMITGGYVLIQQIVP